jgi:hypothetical protein
MKSKLLATIFICGLFANAKAQFATNFEVSTNIEKSFFSRSSDSIRQVDLIDYLRKILKLQPPRTDRSKHKFQFTFFPAESNISGGRTVFTSFNVSFLLGETTNTNVSTIYFIPYISLSNQYGIQFRPDIWLQKNSWNFSGEYFILNYPQSTWGLGGNSSKENEILVDYKHICVHQNVLKGIRPFFSMGLGYYYDNHYKIDPQQFAGDQSNVDNNTISAGLTLPIIYDSRKNSNNPQNGFMANFTYRYNSPFFGSDNEWQSIFFDVRKYFPMRNRLKDVVALRSYYWTILSGKVPYLDLPANNWEPIFGSVARGIEQNRYRSNAIIYSEAEYRFGITANGFLGGVVFVSVTSPSQYNTQNFLYWHPAAGFGMRFKFNKYSRTNIRLDYGFSKEYQSLYLNIGEAF